MLSMYLFYCKWDLAMAHWGIGAGGEASVDDGGTHLAGVVLAVRVRDFDFHDIAGEVEHPDADGDKRNPDDG